MVNTTRGAVFFRELPTSEMADEMETAYMLMKIANFLNEQEVRRRDERVAKAREQGREPTEKEMAIWDSYTVEEKFDRSPEKLKPLDNYMLDADVITYMKQTLQHDPAKWYNWAVVNEHTKDFWFSEPVPWKAITEFGYRPRDGYKKQEKPKK